MELWQNQVIPDGSRKKCEESGRSENRTDKLKEPLGKYVPGYKALSRCLEADYDQ